MAMEKATPRSGGYGGVGSSASERDGRIVSEYERGCKWAALAMAAALALMGAMEVVSSWM